MPRRAAAVAAATGDPKEALREHLLATAGILLADRQVASITTRDIARAAGVSDGVLYNHFGEKSELLVAALARRFGELVAAFREHAPQAGSGAVRENVVRLVRQLFELDLAALPLGAKLISEPGLLSRFWHDIHSGGEGPSGRDIRDVVVAYLAGEQRLGRIAEIDREAVADLILGAVALRATLHLLHGSDESAVTADLASPLLTILEHTKET
ncbi:MAG TPA: TetR/AcrR family transcriptional regulator [Gaiellaceae bacterium]|jgi:AcrR family transcriptional regulator